MSVRVGATLARRFDADSGEERGNTCDDRRRAEGGESSPPLMLCRDFDAECG